VQHLLQLLLCWKGVEFIMALTAAAVFFTFPLVVAT